MIRAWSASHPLLAPSWVLALSAAVLRAQTVTVSPAQVEVRLDGTCQFHARLDPEPAGPPPLLHWRLESLDGQAAPAGLGQVDASGLYRAPSDLPSGPSKVRVRAALAGDDSRSGAAEVTLLRPVAEAADSKRDVAQPVETKGAARGLTVQEAARLPQLAELKPRADVTIPTPPFSLAGLDDRRKMAPRMVQLWQTCLGQGIEPQVAKEWRSRLAHPDQAALPAHRYALFHGIGMASQRRVLNCYYENVDQLGAEAVFQLSPWVVLGLRNVLSCTLIDVTHPRTWYPIGFLLDAPLESIQKTDPVEAMVPMESMPYDQEKFRAQLLFDNPLSPEQEQAITARFFQYLGTDSMQMGDSRAVYKQLEQEYLAEHQLVRTRAYGPESRASIQEPKHLLGRANEVGCFSRITHPEKSVRILAVVLTGSGKYRTAVDAKDVLPEGGYETVAAEMAKALNLPLYDLRRKQD